MAELNVQLRDGDTTHEIAERGTPSPGIVGIRCRCGFSATMRAEHEVVTFALHLAAPQSDAAGLASVYNLAVQAVAVARDAG